MLPNVANAETVVAGLATYFIYSITFKELR